MQRVVCRVGSVPCANAPAIILQIVYSQSLCEAKAVNNEATVQPIDAIINAFRRPTLSATAPIPTAPKNNPKIDRDEIIDDFDLFSQIKSN